MDRASTSHRPAIVTTDQDLLDQLLRLCAAANVTPDVVEDLTRARRTWALASAVLVGDDVAAAVARLGLARRDNVVVVSQARDPTPLWRQAVELRADDVAVLPAAQDHLIERLCDLADGTSRATTVSVIGGSGGAGCSIVAAALALTAARRGRESMLVDADPLGGGIELVVGCEDASGLRWPEVAATRGRVSGVAFRAALPTVGGLAVLSWDRAESSRADPETMSAMVGAAQRGSDLVVIDLARRLDDAATDALLLSDLLLIVVTSEVRGVASAQGLLRGLHQICADIRILVRELPGSGLSSRGVADALGLPLAGRVPSQRAIARAVNDGLGPLGRGTLERACRGILDRLATSPVDGR